MKRLYRAGLALALVAGMVPAVLASPRLVLYEYFSNTG
jgi:hypothetical protein